MKKTFAKVIYGVNVNFIEIHFTNMYKYTMQTTKQVFESTKKKIRESFIRCIYIIISFEKVNGYSTK